MLKNDCVLAFPSVDNKRIGVSAGGCNGKDPSVTGGLHARRDSIQQKIEQAPRADHQRAQEAALGGHAGRCDPAIAATEISRYLSYRSLCHHVLGNSKARLPPGQHRRAVSGKLTALIDNTPRDMGVCKQRKKAYRWVHCRSSTVRVRQLWGNIHETRHFSSFTRLARCFGVRF